jgi:AcrR family transcriptional regulator
MLKERIIHESMKLFSVKGYTSTSTTDIIKAAQTSKGGFYNHFKSKEQLFNEVLSEGRHIWRERNLYQLDDILRPLAKIQKLLENYRDRYLADAECFPGGCLFVNLAVELNDQSPELANRINEGFVRLQAMIQRLLDEEKEQGGIAREVNTADAAGLVMSGILGACVMHSSNKSKKQLNATIAALISYLQSLSTKH